MFLVMIKVSCKVQNNKVKPVLNKRELIKRFAASLNREVNRIPSIKTKKRLPTACLLRKFLMCNAENFLKPLSDEVSQ